MGLLSKLAHAELRHFLWIGLPIIAVVGFLASTDLGAAWRAHGGDGVKGTFTAVREQCGRHSCSFYGNWAPAGGGAARTDVILYDEPDSMRVGDTTAALDSGAGNGVFAAAGGTTYLLVSGLAVVGAAAAIGWLFLVRRTVARRRKLWES